ncbi:MAG: NAD(+)/NADH kinase [Acidimicrobiales bacterium]
MSGGDQLHERLRADPRVEVHEQTSVRGLDPGVVGGPAPVLVADLSFISLRTVLDSLLSLTSPEGDLILLVKPQFEAGRHEADRGRGVIRDGAVHRRTVTEVCGALEARQAAIMGVMVSPSPAATATSSSSSTPVAAGDRRTRPPTSWPRRCPKRPPPSTAAPSTPQVARKPVGADGRRRADRPPRPRGGVGDGTRGRGLVGPRGPRGAGPREDAAVSGLEAHAVDPEGFAGDLDLVVTLGGDGSILRAVELVGDEGVPILGVNHGQLGYLTEIEPADALAAVGRALAGEHRIDERMLLAVSIRTAAGTEHHLALNEAVVERSAEANTIRLAVDVDGEFFTTYAADGVIVATPTGSTAYAFSARGPIVEPTHSALLLTPVSPHMLFDRSLVLAPSTRLRLTLDGHRAATVSVDGRRVAVLADGDAIECTAAARGSVGLLRAAPFPPRTEGEVRAQ